jgi:hypothetical protein
MTSSLLRGWILALTQIAFTSALPGLAEPVASTPLPPPPNVGRQIAPVKPPRDARGVVTLFSGQPLEMAANWLKVDGKTPADWPVAKGAMTVGKGLIISRYRFTDFHLHLELRTPWMPDKHGQGRGNSGVFLQGRYEVQVLDSYGLADPGTGDCGAVYAQSAPLVNACKPPTAWQTFDYIFRAPRFDADGKLTEPARVTVIQNGLVVQNNTVITGPNNPELYGKLSEPGPITLQDHHNPVQYRNIWVVPLPLKGADHY